MEDERFELSLKEFERMGASVMKKAFRSFRQILILLLYVVAVFFVLNDFSFTVTSAEELAAGKLPWLALYILAHYFCRDYGIQKGREDEEYRETERVYRELCGFARGRRQEVEQYCAELSERYNKARRAETLSALGVETDANGEPVLSGIGGRTALAVKRALRVKPIKITYRALTDQCRGKSREIRPLKPSFESYVRRSSMISVLKIVLLSCFTFSLTATIGSDPLGSLIGGIPYLATMLSVSMTAALGAYRSVITYEIDCINDRVAILEGIVSKQSS